MKEVEFLNNYILQSNEGMLDECKSASLNSGQFDSTFLLTTINLVWIQRGTFLFPGKSLILPLKQIKVVNDRAQVLLNESGPHGVPSLDVFLRDGRMYQITFLVEGRDVVRRNKIKKWINLIQQELVGNEIYGSEDFEDTRESLMGSILEVKEAIFGPSKKPKKNESEESKKRMAISCKACGAPLEGYRGSIKKCEYCDTSNEL